MEQEKKDVSICPHCGSKMKKWRVPLFFTWTSEFFYVCFNDDCPYYQRGWKHMFTTYRNPSSYRYRYDPETGQSGPIPVWSPEDLKDGIME